MRRSIERLAIAAVLLGAGIAVSSATPPTDGAAPLQLAATAGQTGVVQKLICVYSTGSQIHSCAITVITAQTKVGWPCYCGHSPKGIIRAVPLTMAPD